MNDIVIPDPDNGIGKRHMVVKYNLDDNEYYIRDLGDGTGTFV
jgi:pSer/pThr/pTyr-binding forkhead associated (FHA) protein